MDIPKPKAPSKRAEAIFRASRTPSSAVPELKYPFNISANLQHLLERLAKEESYV